MVISVHTSHVERISIISLKSKREREREDKRKWCGLCKTLHVMGKQRYVYGYEDPQAVPARLSGKCGSERR
jgi:RNase P subunit RPR2